MKYYLGRQEASANIELASALKTFQSYLGTISANSMSPGDEAFATAADKYKKALGQFNAIVLKYRMFPRPKAVSIALYHAGICESLLGNSGAAINKLREASRDGDREIATLSQFALAGEFLKSGKTQEAIKTYQYLADHPSLAVPRARALLALADAYKDSQPARARAALRRNPEGIRLRPLHWACHGAGTDRTPPIVGYGRSWRSEGSRP